MIIKNVDSISHTWGGLEFTADMEFTPSTLSERIAFANDSVFLVDLASELATVTDQDILITDFATAVGLLRGDISNVNVNQFKTTSQGMPKIATYEPEGDASTIITHNFCDKCSWYQDSVHVTDGSMSTSDNLVFTSAHEYWIDLNHGRMYGEHAINATGTYTPVIKVDGTTVTTGFTIDYPAGTVTFDTEQTGTVTASYYYATTSYYTLRPKSGKILSIKAAEIQFSYDISLTSPFVFEGWIDHPTYGLIPVPGTSIKYKNAKDWMGASNRGDVIPAWGELTKQSIVLPFNYARPKALVYSQNTMIKIYLENHEPLGSEYATGTFYVVVDNEP